MPGFFEWCDALPLAQFIRGSRVLFPIIETIHILGLTVLLGIVFIRGLRLMGMRLSGDSAERMSRALAPLRNGSLAVMIASGLLLFISEALKCYDSPPFRLKMLLLLAALLFEYTALPWMTRSRVAALGGALSLILWFGVGAAGRAIGFY